MSRASGLARIWIVHTQPNAPVNVVIQSTTAYGQFPVLHDPVDHRPIDGTVQTESIVYLIHDDRDLRDRICKVIEMANLAIERVDSVEDFIESYDDGRDSCLITDLKLQQKTGLELLRTIENQSIYVPSIFVTSRADVKSAIDVMRSGAVTLLETPFDDDELRDAIDEAQLA